MAVRKPIVLVGGELQQLQSGDTLYGQGNEVGVITLTNSDAAATAIGDVMYIFGSDALKKAKADAPGTSECFGFAMAVIAAAATGAFQTDGIISGLSGLTPGAIYYLSAATAGLMTVTAPSTTGQTVVRLGKALSATEFEINIERGVLL
jgi:hypothetical protein